LRIVEFSLVAARLLLAAVFLLAGATKLIDPFGTRKALRDFGVPAVLARPLVLLLPLLELVVAAALIPAGLVWYGAWGALGLLVLFLLAVGVAMARGRKPDCHCFGQLHSAPVGRTTLIRNAVLAACAGWLISRGQLQSEPDLWRWFATLDLHERKVAIVAACAAALLFFRLLDRSRPESVSIRSQSPPDVDDDDDNLETSREAPAKGRPAPALTENPEPARRNVMGVGLPIGTPAPEFELPGITGERRSLRSLRAHGRDVLLVFSSPFCKPCEALASSLVRWMREMEGLPSIVLVSRGTVQDNLAKLKEFEPSRVLLQRNFEVAEEYDCDSTPTAVLVGADGLIRSTLAVGGVAIKQLLSSSAKHTSRAKII
jgi:peroxiredoxin